MVAVALVRADGSVLMQQRPFANTHGGLWEFPGGKVDPGESPEHAAVRELQEELGLTLDADLLEAVGFASGWTGAEGEAKREAKRRSLVILLYACRQWQGEPHPHEAEAIDWLAPGAIETLAMPPLDYPLARALCKFLEESSI
ncbi:(deoxy)nucleoside triphosphate pyrophosphohydrolase [Novosphingobium sp. KA1]|uniref:(deoxy)nucleoside triphosphate pyrophosphohydrolase n=1 Tax=Novosphingobium sp. (strain KA1) TaxID=164608 RepID=UPI002107E3D2|nr:(deoxy)nucleoside triphosphate pyrophosphohydrolase [Novosphingobium sp. KA1]